MKYAALFFFVACFLVASNAEDEKKEEEVKVDDAAKTYKRVIPADVLRDFPGMCFASTRCATVMPGESWDLTPFCGRSKCVASEDNPPRLLELVEDCGPLPLANPKCKLDTEKTNKTAPFPLCCPNFTCEDGAKLEYPEIPAAPAAAAATPEAKAA